MSRPAQIRKPIPREQIEKTEALLGVSFPDVYKTRMENYNGGSVTLGEEVFFLFPFRDSTSRKTLQRTADDLAVATRNQKDGRLAFPENAVVLGRNNWGDSLILRAGSDGRLGPEVFVLRHRGGEVELVLDDVEQLPGR